ncbi:MAG: SDR family oxidoreductase [Candidatus Rokubacteria bacterium]|nr:SDR family oxidoreductase [Candidatus Rokubacteria bacterium]
MKLDGRGAVITGASLGLGRAIAEAYVREGAHVVLMARGEAALHTTADALTAMRPSRRQRVVTVAGDVASVADVARLRAAAEGALPFVDVLVNNAGVYGPMGRLEDVDWRAWVDAIAIDLIGTAAVCRAFIPLFRARHEGALGSARGALGSARAKIINLSGGGATAPLPRFSAYAAAKAAVVRLTETLAQELADAGVDVNAIAPGALNTRLLDEVLAAGPEQVGSEFHARAQTQHEDGGVPLERGAELAVFLASSESDGITGRLISAVWDDWRALPGRRAELAGSDVFTLRRIVPADRGLGW